MKAKIEVSLKKGVLDPQGKAVQHALESLGYSQIKEVRVGKVFEVDFPDSMGAIDPKLIQEMAQKLLANPVMEDWKIIS